MLFFWYIFFGNFFYRFGRVGGTPRRPIPYPWPRPISYTMRGVAPMHYFILWGVLNALHRGGVLDLPKKSVMFDYSIGLEPVGSVHFRAPVRPWRAGAIERGAARAADAKIDFSGVKKWPKNDPKKTQKWPKMVQKWPKKLWGCPKKCQKIQKNRKNGQKRDPGFRPLYQSLKGGNPPNKRH